MNYVALIDIIYIGGDYYMHDEDFSIRLAKLRTTKGVSARDMSLSIGQNPGYINNIETGKALPSMSTFFYICDYFQISPKDFFDENQNNFYSTGELIREIQKLTGPQVQHLLAIIKDINHSH